MIGNAGLVWLMDTAGTSGKLIGFIAKYSLSPTKRMVHISNTMVKPVHETLTKTAQIVKGMRGKAISAYTELEIQFMTC